MGISRLRQYALSILLTVWSVVFPGTLHAQLTACTAEGVVRDTTGAAISYAVVSVFPELSEGATTGQAVGTAVTDDDGFWSIPLPDGGGYLIRCEHMAFETCDFFVVVGEETVRLETVLAPSAEYIEAVEVLGVPIRYSAGRYEVTMEGSELARNRNANELLGLLPGITTYDGLRLHGKSVGIVYIDDRRVEDRDELAALRAEDIEKVSVQNRAGASEDATTKGGVVRITLRRPDDGGYYGTVTGSVSFTPQSSLYRLLFIFNYQKGRWNVYNYLSGAYGYGYETQTRQEEFRRGGYTQFSDVTERSAARSLSETFGVVYDLSDRHAVGFTVRVRLDGRDNASVASICREIAGNTESNAFGEYAYDGEMLLPQYQAAFNYTFDIDTLGSQFAVKADYMHTASKRRTDYRSVPSAGTEETYREFHAQSADALDTRIDMDKYFVSGGLLSVGGRYYRIGARFDQRREDMTGGEWTPNPETSMYYGNETQGAALYGEYSGSRSRFSYMVGVRMQYDRIDYKTGGNAGHHDYWRFIPSASLAYTFNRGKGDNLNLDIYRYGGSLPDPAQLSPLPVRISENSYYVGNPRLEPYTGFCADLTYTHRGRWTFAYGFDRAQHMSQNLTTLPSDDSGLSIVSPVNLGLSLTHSLSVGVNIPLTGWLRLSAHIYGYYASNRYGTMSYDDWHAEVYTSLMFAVLPSMGAQLSLSGSSPTAGLESHSGDSYGLSGSIYKTFFDGRLYVSLGFGGLFYRKWQIQETVKTDGSYYAVIRRRNHNRQWISLSASFRFRHNVRKPFRTVEMLQEMQEEL